METFFLVKSKFIIEKWQSEAGLLAGITSKHPIDLFGQKTTLNLGLHVGDNHQHVVENRHFIAQEIGIPLQKWVGSQQTHGRRIKKVTLSEAGLGSEFYEEAIKETDGLYTAQPGILLTQFFADCVPVFFRHKNSKMIGIVHAGWKGTTLGIAGEMIRIWQSQEGIHPSEVEVVIGPCICKKCYQVDDKVIQAIEMLLGDEAPLAYTKLDFNQFNLDLKRANEHVLLKNGVLFENINGTNFCTNCDEQQFFSHRREQGKAGRMMGYIGWL
ncbi:MAG: pgeF, partial [Bacillales bacterium]|nr:pgeF [Bacillales bacterium]